jgi:hypothetical protein
VRRVVIVAALALLSACAHTVAVRVPVLVPAKVPVRSFPSIWISGGTSEDEIYLQDRLAAHLAKDGSHEVRRIELAELEPLRKAGQIPPTTVVVLIDLRTDESSTSSWATSPGYTCGYYGCFTQWQSYPVYVPELLGDVTLTVYEGPTARVLQREHFNGDVTGDYYDTGIGDDAADALVEKLSRQLERAVDVLRIKKRVELYEVDVPGVAEAVALVRRGKWDDANRLLEQATASLAGESTKVQARVWFDLGLVRWFGAPEGLTKEAFEHAKQALEKAVQLDPHPVHKRALADLERARKSFALLEEQRRATAANFAAAGAQPATPK